MIGADAGSNKIAICQRKGELEVESFLEGRQLLPWKINSRKNREIPAIFSSNFFLFRLQMADGQLRCSRLWICDTHPC